ncbi:MAG TPA: hypothetical protein VKK79_13160 [Candidatus Lokiarchaeia archaeon]|nr:hypothetical protein [Candidatus Lokiarchaeia archaeon]
MDLSPLGWYRGITALILVLAATSIAFYTIRHFYRVEERRLLVAATGLFFAGFGSAWYGEFVSFLSIISFGQPISDETYIRINGILTPLALIGWVFVISDLFAKRWQNKVLLASILWSVTSIVIIELFYPSMTYFSDAEHLNLHYSGFADFYFETIIITIFLTGMWLVRVSQKNRDRPEVRLQGQLIFVAVFLASGGTSFDLLLGNNPVVLVLSRTILIVSLIFFYIGFYLPKRIKHAVLHLPGD